MTAEVVVRGELEIRKGIDGMDLDDALMMLDGILMQVCCVGKQPFKLYEGRDVEEDFPKAAEKTKVNFMDVCFLTAFRPLKVKL